MTKKEFYKKYIQSDEDKLMGKIHENARKHQDDKSIMRRAKVKKIGVYVAVATIFGVLGLLIGVLL